MSFLVLSIAVLVFAFLMMPRLRDNAWWRAMVTPLASIIGSGFLVIAPLLARIAGTHAVLAMVAIVVLAYVIGGIIRFNILFAEPLLDAGGAPERLVILERISNLALSVAYVISVAFYIRLLASFALSVTALKGGVYEDWLATTVLAMIALIGWVRGLKGLELVETISVSVKLSIIAALIAALFLHDFANGQWTALIEAEDADWFGRLRLLGGMLLVVQGFETSRYLGGEYGARLRHDTMRVAQIVSGIIYVLFIILVVPLLVYLSPGKTDETAIITLTSHVAWILPVMLVVAALMSQLSAAIADTLGAGGLVHEETGGRIRERESYPFLLALAITLIWLFDIFQVITIASRAFALYYLMQTAIAYVVAGTVMEGTQLAFRRLNLVLMAIVLLFIAVFAVAAE